jgi:SAM-dependent methyltransferase
MLGYLVMFKIYKNAKAASKETDLFYLKSGFQYDIDYVTDWLKKHIQIPKSGNILDLCCGDGIWSSGFEIINPKLNIYGCDISSGGIQKAKTILNKKNRQNFSVQDTEKSLDYDNNFFDLIFARGPGLYNQHDFSSKEAVKIIENWHSILKKDGLFYSIFASKPSMFGKYTDMKDSVLPYNRSPRKTKAVNFLGGKYHHSIKTFIQPFELCESIIVKEYHFSNNLHILTTMKI